MESRIDHQPRPGLWLSAMALAAGLSGCGGGGSDTVSPPLPPPPVATDPILKLKESTASWQQQQLSQLSTVSCPSADCEPSAVSFSAGRFSNKGLKADQTILVIDNSGLELAATAVYRSRVKGFWQWSASGEPVPAQPVVQLPLYLSRLLGRLSEFEQTASTAFVPASWLGELSKRVMTLSPGVTIPYSGHGAAVIDFLAEHNPQAELVLAQTPDFASLFRADFCKGDAAAYQLKISAASSQFYQQVVLGQDVEYLNWSAGWDLTKYVRQSADRLCPSHQLSRTQLQALLAAHQPFYQLLFTSDKLLGVQAGAANFNADEQPLDALALPNRIRAGFFNSGQTASGLDSRGVPAAAVPALPEYQQNSLAVLDVLINFAFAGVGSQCKPAAYSLQVSDGLGMGFEALCSQQTSWAAPVVLSRLIQLREQQFAGVPWSQDLINQLKQQLTPALCDYPAAGAAKLCKLQDPLLHRQQELYRLGYLAR